VIQLLLCIAIIRCVSLYVNISERFSDEFHLPTQYLNIVFKMFSCSNTDFSLPLHARRVSAEPVSST